MTAFHTFFRNTLRKVQRSCPDMRDVASSLYQQIEIRLPSLVMLTMVQDTAALLTA